MTSFYMWRSYYMTFTGEYRGNDHHGHEADAHGHDDHHHHGPHTPHESPKSMTWVLSILALAIPLTISLGWWPLIGVHPIFESWLEPVVGASYESLNWWSKTADINDVHSIEYALAGASVIWAIATWLLARWMYKDAKNELPAKLLASPNRQIRKTYDLVFNKYWVDEFYDVMIVQRTRQWSRVLYTIDQRIVDGIVNFCGVIGRAIANIEGMIDSFIVDGLVNGVANGLAGIGNLLRRTQTGRIQSYLMGSIVGVLVLIFINYALF